MSVVDLRELNSKAHSDFFKLFEKSFNQPKKRDYPLTDIRADFFVTFAELGLWLLIQLDHFREMLKPNSTIISMYLNLTKNDLKQFWVQHDTINRSSYCSKAMFDIEHFLKTIMSALGVENNKGYYSFSEDFLYEIDFYNPQRFKILNAPAQMRNSLHKDGYASKNFDVILRGHEYNFVRGQQINFAGWDNLYIMFDEIIDLLIEIIKQPRVKGVQQIPRTSEYF